MDYLLDFVVGSPQTPRFPATLIQEARGGRRKMQTEWRSERRLIDHMSGMYTPSRLYANSNVQGGFSSGAKNTQSTYRPCRRTENEAPDITKRNEERIIGVAELRLAENRGRKIETTLCKSAIYYYYYLLPSNPEP